MATATAKWTRDKNVPLVHILKIHKWELLLVAYGGYDWKLSIFPRARDGRSLVSQRISGTLDEAKGKSLLVLQTFLFDSVEHVQNTRVEK